MPFYVSEVLYFLGGMQNGTSLSNIGLNVVVCNVKEKKINTMSLLDLTALFCIHFASFQQIYLTVSDYEDNILSVVALSCV